MLKDEIVIVDGIRRILNLKPSRAIHRDWRAAQMPSFANPVKDEVNWLPGNWEAFNQVETGTCVGQMASGVYYCMTGVILSRMQIWLNAVIDDEWDETVPGALGNGTSLKAALDYLRKVGAVPEIQWPFWPYHSWYKGMGDKLLAESKKHRIDSYYNLGKDQTLWKLWLSNYGPVCLAISVDTSYLTVKEDGIVKPFNSKNLYGGHAIYCSGYKDGRYDWPGSWGWKFAKNGIVKADEAYADAAVVEAYGIIA